MKDRIDILLEKADFAILLRLLPYVEGSSVERLERFEKVLQWIIPFAVLGRILTLCV